MVKKLIQHGNSVALVIDKPIMEILKITNETTFFILVKNLNWEFNLANSMNIPYQL
jgi:hypothetical protein